MAEAKAETEKKPEEGAAAPKGGKKKLIIIVAAVLVLGGGVGGFMMMGGSAPKEGEHVEEQEAPPPVYEVMPLDTFVVNLQDVGRFLKASISIEYDPEIFHRAEAAAHGEGSHGGGSYTSGSGGGAHGGGGGEPAGPVLPGLVTKRMPVIKHVVLKLLGSKKVEQLMSIEGRERLQEETVEVINEAIGLDESPVINVYFTEFIIQ